MPTNNDMRERLEQVEQKVDQFVKRVDLLATKEDLKEFATKEDLKEFATKADLKEFATKADLAAFATKADLDTFTEEIKNHMGIMLEDAKSTIRSAADGYKGTLERIERDLGELNKKVDVNFSSDLFPFQVIFGRTQSPSTMVASSNGRRARSIQSGSAP